MSNCELRMNKFANLTQKYPMHRDGRKTLYFVVEHQPDHTRAGYEVEQGGKTTQFVDLADAVKFFNERRRRK